MAFVRPWTFPPFHKNHHVLCESKKLSPLLLLGLEYNFLLLHIQWCCTFEREAKFHTKSIQILLLLCVYARRPYIHTHIWTAINHPAPSFPFYPVQKAAPEFSWVCETFSSKRKEKRRTSTSFYLALTTVRKAKLNNLAKEGERRKDDEWKCFRLSRSASLNY